MHSNFRLCYRCSPFGSEDDQNNINSDVRTMIIFKIHLSANTVYRLTDYLLYQTGFLPHHCGSVKIKIDFNCLCLFIL